METSNDDLFGLAHDGSIDDAVGSLFNFIEHLQQFKIFRRMLTSIKRAAKLMFYRDLNQCDKMLD